MLSEARSESKSDTPENKCSILQKLYSPTIRLSISLREPDDESCSVYNYISLISEEVSRTQCQTLPYIISIVLFKVYIL